MPRTKYLVVGTAFALVGMMSGGLLFAVKDVSISAQFAAVGDALGSTSHEGDLTPSVTVDAPQKDLSVRDRLREKLAHFSRDTAQTSPPPDAETIETDHENVADAAEIENGIIEGGKILGDDQVSASPQAGYLYACAPALRRGAPIATPWIAEGVWYPEMKAEVEGSIPSNGVVSIAVTDAIRTVTSDGLPNHPHGTFEGDVLTPRALSASLPRVPTLTSVPYCVSSGAVGIARNGVAIYAGQNAYGEDAVAYELLDACGGRPGENGLYHYYAESSCLFDRVYEGAPSTLLGYALDGFGIFARSESGETIQNADLDACHGHEHMIPWDGDMVSMYHYHMTDEFPYSVGCFMGEPASLSIN